MAKKEAIGNDELAVEVTKKRKAYRDFTDEEKAEYKEKRAAWLEKKAEQTAKNFELLKVELLKLKADDKTMKLFELCAQTATKTGERAPNVTHMTTMFGTETPEPGTKVTYDFISLRGPNGERMKSDEDKKTFINRMGGDVNWTKDSRTINEMVWYTVRRGINLTIDKVAMTVTFVG